MLKSCKYCGRIHETTHICKQKAKAQQEYYTDINAKQKKIRLFRSSKTWMQKREDIRERDVCMCQICVRNLYDTVRQFNGNDIQVHHIIPLVKDWNKRLDDTNLISLCPFHHVLAESGEIPAQLLLRIAKEQEQNMNKKYAVLASYIQ